MLHPRTYLYPYGFQLHYLRDRHFLLDAIPGNHKHSHGLPRRIGLQDTSKISLETRVVVLVELVEQHQESFPHTAIPFALLTCVLTTFQHVYLSGEVV